ncbi:MAG TPA: 4Fe-4S binding protein [Candidatus Polarisedimenticolia bacterium]|jgi:Pyruvate/2-oxoacid:ferredoxin oxidoreductase delta subunit|nr:4Fe-4S binding protein [Candidatus Polarisedimenticolia bacterium]
MTEQEKGPSLPGSQPPAGGAVKPATPVAPAASATPAAGGTAPAPSSAAPPAKPAPAAARKPRKPRPKALINENGCTGCEACITVCPVDCIVKIPNPSVPELNPICRVDWDRCTGCTICARDCPWETIDMLYPNQPGIRVLVESYHLPEYGTQFVPEPQEEEAVA